MTIRQNVTAALHALHESKVRALLTMLGIIIGISSFILINAVGAGAQNLILDQIRRIGSNLVAILPGAADETGPPASVFGISIRTLKVDDVEDVVRNVPDVIAGSGYARGTINVTYDNESRFYEYNGVNSEYLNIEDAEIENGRFFTEQENARISRVAVLGSDVAKEFFGINDPVGESIRLKGERYTVIGTMKERGTTAFQNPDKVILIPLNTAQKIIQGVRHLSLSRVKVRDGADTERVLEEIRSVIRENHRIEDPKNDDFDVRSTEQALGILTTVTGALKLFLTIIAAISLVVGGIGIMNIMYVAVTERSFEIGLRKALGATNKVIMRQFLTEAVVVTVFAGILGILLGSLLAWLVAVIVTSLGYAWVLVISPTSVLTAFGISVLIGIVFGLYPARKAAEKSPVEAMRGA